MIYGFSQYSWAFKTNTTKAKTDSASIGLWDALAAKCAKLWNAFASSFGTNKHITSGFQKDVELITSNPQLEEQILNEKPEEPKPVPVEIPAKSSIRVVKEISTSQKLRSLQRRLDVSHKDYKRFNCLPPGSLILTRGPRTSNVGYLEDKKYLFRSQYFYIDFDGVRQDLDFSLEEDVEKLIAFQQAGGYVEVSGNEDGYSAKEIFLHVSPEPFPTRADSEAQST